MLTAAWHSRSMAMAAAVHNCPQLSAGVAQAVVKIIAGEVFLRVEKS